MYNTRSTEHGALPTQHIAFLIMARWKMTMIIGKKESTRVVQLLVVQVVQVD